MPKVTNQSFKVKARGSGVYLWTAEARELARKNLDKWILVDVPNDYRGQVDCLFSRDFHTHHEDGSFYIRLRRR